MKTAFLIVCPAPSSIRAFDQDVTSFMGCLQKLTLDASMVTRMGTRLGHRAIGCFLLCGFVSLAMPQWCGAQGFGIGGIDLQGQFIEAPRAISQVLSDAREAIEAERYSDAVLLLGDLLARDTVAEEDADLAGQDFFLDGAEATNLLSRSLIREAERTLGELPAKGHEIYELRYGARAKQLLDEATSKLDRALLRELSRRYLYTKAGREGTLLLAEMEVSEGRPVAAVAIYRRLASVPQARQEMGDGLLVKLAAAEALANYSDVAVEHLRAAGMSGAELGSAFGKLALPADGEDAMQWLESRFGQLRGSLGVGPESLQIAQGGASGIGPGGGGLPLSLLRWEVPTTVSRKQLQFLTDFSNSDLVGARGRNAQPPPSWQPIFVGQQLLMRTTERMIAIDFETGLRIWEYPWTAEPTKEEEDPVLVAARGDVSDEDALLLQRVWNDLPYGRMSSDGRRVFLLNDLGLLETNNLSPFRMPMSNAGAGEGNTLVALDVETEGKLLWARGKNGEEPVENNLKDAFFMGPPLPIEGALYQLVELAGDTYLLCLDAATGREQWRQQLLANEGGAIQQDPIRRIAGAVPAYSDGILVCPTSSGAMVAMDLSSRSLLWGTYFPRNDATMLLRSGRGMQRGGIDQRTLMNRWTSGTPIIADGRVLVTPAESDRLYGFDLLTGEPLWPAILRQDYQYLAGARDGKFLLVSSSGAMAYDIVTGQKAWSVAYALPPGERVSGTGVFGDGIYLLPTSQKSIVSIDLTKGTEIARRPTEFPPGNLLAVEDSLVSQSASMLAVAYLEEPLQLRVDEVLEEKPDSVWALVRRGELLLQEGKREEAVEWLLRARELSPDDEDVRVRLVVAMLDSLRSGKQPTAEMTDLLEQLIELPSQRIDLLRLKVEEALRDNRAGDAGARLLELAVLLWREERTQLRAESQYFADANGGRATSDAWISGRVEEALEQMTSEEREAFEREVGKQMGMLLGAPVTVQRRAITQFVSVKSTDTIRKGLFETALKDGYWVQAERLAEDAILAGTRMDDADRQTDWQSMLVNLYGGAGFFADAAEILEELKGKEAEGIEPQVARLVRDSSAAVNWPRGVRMSAMDQPVRGRMERFGREPIDVVSRRGLTTSLWHPMIDRTGMVVMRSGTGEQRSVINQTGQNVNELVQASLDRGVMIMLMPQELVAIDLLSYATRPADAVLWKWPWREQFDDSLVRSRSEQSFFGELVRAYRVSTSRDGQDPRGVVRLGPIVGRHFYFLQGSELIAIDVVSGSEIWRKAGYAEDAYIVADLARVGVVSASEGIEILRGSDGSLLSQRAWNGGELAYEATGRFLLSSAKVPAEDGSDRMDTVVSLQDPLGDREVLSLKIEANPETGIAEAYARLIDGQKMVLMTPQGRLVVWDLQRGVSVIDQQVNLPGKLKGIQVLPWSDGLVVAAVRREDRVSTDPPGTLVRCSAGVEHVDIDGPLYFVDSKLGEVRWTREIDGPWGITVNQASGSPLMFLSRSKRSYPDPGRALLTLDLLAIDTRDGSELVRVDAMAAESNFNALQTETLVVAPQFVETSIDRYVFGFRFVDEPLPEAERRIGDESIKKMHAESKNGDESEGPKPPALIPLGPGERLPGR